jgi:hypothetical protein
MSRVIVTGPEGSGGALVAKTVAHVLGVSHYDEWDGVWPNAVESSVGTVQHVSLPAGKPSKFPDVFGWLNDDAASDVSFILTVRDNGISVRSKMRRAGKTQDEAQGDNSRAAQLMDTIARSTRPYFFFSYEALLYLRITYLRELYRFLGVSSDFVPPLVDANARYLREPLDEGGPVETDRPVLG